MNKLELLELAAKAAGIEFDFCRPDLGGCQIRKGLTSGWWNPLEDDGDALRLAVKLGMSVDVWEGDVKAIAWGGGEALEKVIDNDPYAATRRAIVRAAAENKRDYENWKMAAEKAAECEREACAKVCEPVEGYAYEVGVYKTMQTLAAAIRVRSEQ